MDFRLDEGLADVLPEDLVDFVDFGMMMSGRSNALKGVDGSAQMNQLTIRFLNVCVTMNNDTQNNQILEYMLDLSVSDELRLFSTLLQNLILFRGKLGKNSFKKKRGKIF